MASERDLLRSAEFSAQQYEEAQRRHRETEYSYEEVEIRPYVEPPSEPMPRWAAVLLAIWAVGSGAALYLLWETHAKETVLVSLGVLVGSFTVISLAYAVALIVTAVYWFVRDNLELIVLLLELWLGGIVWLHIKFGEPLNSPSPGQSFQAPGSVAKEGATAVRR